MIRFRNEIIAFQPNQVLTVRTHPGSQLQFERTFSLRAAGGAAEVADEWKLDTGWNGPVEKLAASTVKKAVFDNTVRLKELLETGSTFLLDGGEAELDN